MIKKLRIVIFMVVCLGCSFEWDSGLNPNPEPTTPVEQGSFTVEGIVKDYPYNRVITTGVRVSLGDQTQITGADGSFSFSLEGNPRDYVINMDAYRYALYSKSLAGFQGRKIILNPRLSRYSRPETLNPQEASGYTLLNSSGITLIDIPDISDLGISENLELASNDYSASQDGIKVIPGDCRGEGLDVQIHNIAFFGAESIRLTGRESGEEYSLKDSGKTFNIGMSGIGYYSDAPETISLWYYDSLRGLWIEDGTASMSIPDPEKQSSWWYTAAVNRLGFWCAAVKLPAEGCVSGVIEDSGENIYEINIKGSGFYRTFSTPHKNVSLSGLPQDMTLDISTARSLDEDFQVLRFQSHQGCVDLGRLFLEGAYELDIQYVIFGVPDPAPPRNYMEIYYTYPGLGSVKTYDIPIHVPPGVEITISPQQVSNFEFSNTFRWQYNGWDRSSEPSYTFTINEDVMIGFICSYQLN